MSSVGNIVDLYLSVAFLVILLSIHAHEKQIMKMIEHSASKFVLSGRFSQTVGDVTVKCIC